MCHGLKALLLRLVTSFIQRFAKKINKPVLKGLIFDVLWVFLKKLFLCERRQNFWHDILNKYMKAFTFPSSQSKFDVTDQTKKNLQWKQDKITVGIRKPDMYSFQIVQSWFDLKWSGFQMPFKNGRWQFQNRTKKSWAQSYQQKSSQNSDKILKISTDFQDVFLSNF